MLDSQKVKQARSHLELSMAQAGKLAGMTAQQWEKLENGDGESLTIRTLNRLATALAVPAKDLLK